MDRSLHRELLTLASDPAVELDVLLRRVLRAALALGGTVTGGCETGLAILFDPAEVGRRPVVSAAAQQNGSVPLDPFVKRFNGAPGGRLSRMARTGRPELVPAHVEGVDVGTITGNGRPSIWVPIVERQRLMGLLILESNRTASWTQSQIAELEVVAQVVQPALDRGLLREWIRQAGAGVEILGLSEPLLELERQVKLAGCFSDGSVLIRGERGSGKELVARAIHSWSRRRRRPFVTMLPSLSTDALAGDELFGHEKHSFTGAEKARPGKLQAADGGTLFLDEIAELPLAVQTALLRVLDQGEIQRIGRDESLRVDTRLLVATSRDLSALIASGHFREDLYDRLTFFEVRVSPLRERLEDVPVLARYYLRTYCRRNWRATVFERDGTCSRCRSAARPPCVTEEFFDALGAYSWPGNVRELKHLIGRLVATAPDEVLDAGHLADKVGNSAPPHGDLSLESVVKDHIARILKRTGYNQSQAARLLGLPLSTLRSKMKRLDILLPR